MRTNLSFLHGHTTVRPRPKAAETPMPPPRRARQRTPDKRARQQKNTIDAATPPCCKPEITALATFLQLQRNAVQYQRPVGFFDQSVVPLRGGSQAAKAK
ncbi:hypothetical protein GCM10010336_75240 [Streptomyces goshikiensis]|nr:hypothetical protein GCM10010336_75240 [Streptomyces goshikiensis]